MTSNNETTTMFYTFWQNNSGGGYDRDANLNNYVIVEGRTVGEIVERAESIGIYFNGCEDGTDCECCGDRWSAPYDGGDLDSVPTVYGDVVTNMVPTMSKATVAVIHYLDGSRMYAEAV